MIFLTYLSMAVCEVQAYRKCREEEAEELRKIREANEEFETWRENMLVRAREAERLAREAKEADRLAAEAACEAAKGEVDIKSVAVTGEAGDVAETDEAAKVEAFYAKQHQAKNKALFGGLKKGFML